MAQDYRIEIYDNGKYEQIFDSRYDRHPKRFESQLEADAFAAAIAALYKNGTFLAIAV
ncbi:MAG: hypothetical protein KME45_03155 [Stenomitos rutilans HA7619-LM2]|jgi:hypothetical protein|nr:hypothetical protein [Stenomitos rutilans HA7619-LM2]MBW4469383.1 hypothetical protein [Stenomitos rutilans HA7619-LM2]